jgi:hypothetical protein
MFASDRDLLVLEPRLFNEVAWSALKLVDSNVGAVNALGDRLTITGETFDTKGIGAGHVVLVDGTPAEVLARQSATQLTVSRLRAFRDGAPIPVPAGSNLRVLLFSFAPMIDLAHQRLMRCLGIRSGALADGEGPEESAITNPGALIELEALLTLHAVYSAAAVTAADDSALWAKAEAYRARSRVERERTGAEIDLNGDGVADAVRRVSAVRFNRA